MTNPNLAIKHFLRWGNSVYMHDKHTLVSKSCVICFTEVENAVETSETLEEDDEEEEDGDDGFCDSFNEEGSGAAAVEDEDLTDLEDESSFVSKEDDDSSVSSMCVVSSFRFY